MNDNMENAYDEDCAHWEAVATDIVASLSETFITVESEWHAEELIEIVYERLMNQ